MKRLILGLVLVVFVSSFANSQFKDQLESKPDVYQKLFMRHSFSVSYFSIGGKGFMLNSYTNSILYRFSDNLNLQADISLISSPFSSFGRGFQRSLSGVFIDRVELNYQPFRNVFINIQYRQVPFYQYYYYPYYRW